MKLDVKNYLVFGAGASGLSVVEYCIKNNLSVRIIDTRELPPNAKKIKSLLPKSHISFGAIQQQWIDQADVIVLSPGVSPHMPEFKQAKTSSAKIIGDIELFAERVQQPYIAITGSNGKSTVTMLVTDILKSQGLNVTACANIGEPALNVLNHDVDIFVLELSSFQLETCQSLSPLAATVLNISDDHLDRHESIEQYAAIKSSIYKNSRYKILPRDENTYKYLASHESNLSFGIDAPNDNGFGVHEDVSGRWLMQGKRKIMRSSDIGLVGANGELNVLAALALTHSLIKNEDEALKAIINFKGLPHRCELVVEHNNVQWIDDSKGTNIGATVSAIVSLKPSLILIVGGVYKGGCLDELCAVVKERVSHVIAFGQDQQIFIDALKDHVDISAVNSLTECIQRACELVAPGQAVLFSPACASFDMFSNYIERGNAFRQAVHAKIGVSKHD